VGHPINSPLQHAATADAVLTLAPPTQHAQGTHRVNVPGFYEHVASMTSSDKADVAAFPFDEGQEQQALGVGAFMGESCGHTGSCV
jgi:hypothetical protein